jgi:hypothetical protein
MGTQIYTNYLNILNDAYKNSLDDTPEKVYPPVPLKVSLRRHQSAVIEKMNEYENSFINGKKVNNCTLFSRYAILGDSVGVGKTLMVLGHIASNIENRTPFDFVKYNKNSNTNFYSLEKTTYTDISNAGCLVIVPHTLFRQWSDEIKTKTNLKTLLLKTKKNVHNDTFLKDITTHDIILVSNTLFKEVYLRTIDTSIRWKRIYIDEADTIEITSTYIRDLPTSYCNFIWFISASFINLLFISNYSLYLSQLFINRYLETNNINEEFKELVHKNFNIQHQSLRLFITNRSTRFLNTIINSEHLLRGNLVIRCKKSFIDSSIQLPSLFSKTIICKPPISHRLVYDIINNNVRQLMNAGDIKAALESLGVKTENNNSIIQAVTENKVKELERLEKTYEFKQSLEYSSLQVKEAALKNLQEKIDQMKEQIDSLKKRVENYKEEICAICYDEFNSPLITSCCSRVFCALCILQSLSRTPTCPMCRAFIQPQSLKKIGDEENTIVPSETETGNKKKIDSFFDILKENPKGKFLVFSRYDNSFFEIMETCKQKNLVSKELKGSKDTIASLLEQFKKGVVNILCMNTLQMGAGLNITEATHVILLHAMNHEEEKQILGRAYRVGRKNELHFIKLLYPNETN